MGLATTEPQCVSKRAPQPGHAEFKRLLLDGLARQAQGYQPGNIDFWRFPAGARERARQHLKDVVFRVLSRFGLSPTQGAVDVGWFAAIAEHLEDFERAYALLGDDRSRHLFVELLKFRVLGQQRVRLPRNDTAYWRARRHVERRLLRTRNTLSGPWGLRLNLYEVPGQSGSVRLHGHPLVVLNTFALEQYTCHRDDLTIGARPGDVVIDGGGCWGDTALYLADRVGPDGHVYSFEFEVDNLEIHGRNLELNPQLAARVELVRHALWDRSGETLRYTPNGPGTGLGGEMGPEQPSRAAVTIALDDFVAQRRLARVDLIKLDIEGAELRALEGAETTLRTFRPALAVSLYHRQDDFFVIPDYLHSLGLGYEFYLDHFTIHAEETVLFATARP